MVARFKSITPGAHLSDQVAEVLAAEIRAGRLAVGEKLPTEVALVEQFSVSRTVVREAVSRLKSLGLVDSRQGSGMYVRDAGFSPLNFDARSEVAALATQRCTPTDVQRIRRSISALEQAVLAGGDGVDEDIQFHRAIAEAARNPFLIGTLEYLGQFLRGATRVTRANEARRADFARQVQDEHEMIARAIEAGDPAVARLAASRHMDNAIQRIEQADPSFWQQAGVQLAQPLVRGLASKD